MTRVLLPRYRINLGPLVNLRETTLVFLRWNITREVFQGYVGIDIFGVNIEDSEIKEEELTKEIAIRENFRKPAVLSFGIGQCNRR